MLKTRIAIFLGLVAYATLIVLPWQRELAAVCGDFNKGSPAYARCSLSLEAGHTAAEARAAA